jgi:hypothetical protein
MSNRAGKHSQISILCDCYFRASLLGWFYEPPEPTGTVDAVHYPGIAVGGLGG